VVLKGFEPGGSQDNQELLPLATAWLYLGLPPPGCHLATTWLLCNLMPPGWPPLGCHLPSGGSLATLTGCLLAGHHLATSEIQAKLQKNQAGSAGDDISGTYPNLALVLFSYLHAFKFYI